MPTKKPESLSYKSSGVDIDAGEALVERIKPIAARTRRAECLGGIGGFGGLFQIDTEKYKDPVLVAGTDGVGTKLKLAIESKRHNTIGIDLVAMCVNDIIVCGAEPLFFLDYFATAKLDPDHGEDVVTGIAEGCMQSGAALLGGETAEMPGMYAKNDYDLAGFGVGIIERSEIIDGKALRAGDVILGIHSSGPHSNGYSLIRNIIKSSGAALTDNLDGKSLIDHLIEPTRIYVKSILALRATTPISAIAHITGGGLPGNVNRVLTNNVDAVINTSQWQWPVIFNWLQKNGNIATGEMYRTFNCGIGMIVVVRPDAVEQAKSSLIATGEVVSIIGSIEAGDGSVIVK